ncbi:hypothetical protein [Streptomyces mutomycini]|uniref:hypothetical protein n=1 Tax=Streptomyces mutomycini TaxID=284036 RepID=UPI0033E920B5
MSRRTIESNLRRASSILAVLPQRLSARSSLPAALLSVPRHRTRPRPKPNATDLAQLRADNATLTTMLDEAERAEALRVDEINDLYAEAAKSERTSDELRGENEELYDKLQESQRLISYLRDQMQAAGQHSAAYAPADTPAIDYPTSFAEPLERLRELPHLSFTGNRKTTQGLDSQSVDNWLNVAWDGLLALNHFARASADGTAGGDFLSWCKSDESGAFPFPAAKVAMRESDTVAKNGKLRSERMLPVPVAVEPGARRSCRRI